ncbi:glycerol-3-phosphate dehydrogenase [Paenibacillus jamilae]|uniref:Glycerol-3-phosphate dehydrogenase n=1 Tax=Paenibacillus jamilae TaxID=114136 RepID=A0ACC4ZVR1_9BACL|nr:MULTISPECIES: FAD-dependent oxidoreductase [Paenibacillus]AJE51937.1 glycerol-3-phosphate dehydrogenase [Paenibacillus polymyxa]AUO06708.1 glycerol-3-phosphate dehydrogenase/oxidase [Paenibacillus sp. lzh-N1]KTS82740.1 glycerol-3-phosphate dehydrogenase [Paenibacillus jamilae]QOH64249.1 glycerol-3-phosphate dehydrogenase/oxidase [Paenibacillus polymyxa]
MGEQGFAAQERTAVLERMGREHFDILIIGGGITGAGIALDAADRGLKTALVEMQDFAAGTSSRSTKLVHGGLRYLKQFEVKMVAEVGKERAIVFENGPHVTIPERMLLPFHQGGTFNAFTTSIGLLVYDFLAGVKRSERRCMLDIQTTLEREPLLKREGLRGSGSYVEYRTDDARLTIEVMKEAVTRGALAVNYAKADKLLYDSGRISGASVTDRVTGKPYEIRASLVINAAGPWVDTLREMDRSKEGKVLRLTKGIHLVFDAGRFPLQQAVYFDTPDGRMVFAIPRDGKTYAGTTDTVYEGDTAHPRMTAEDRAYVLQAINGMFPDVKLTVTDVESSWAGVRPLIYEDGKSPSEISRKDEIWESRSGLITIAGGKLTGYRKMSELVVDRAVRELGRLHGQSFRACRTRHIPISGGSVGGSAGWDAFVSKQAIAGAALGLPPETARAWAVRYGSNVERLFAIATQSMKNSTETEAALPVELRVPLLYAMEQEMTVTPSDFFIRRTGALFFQIDEVKRWKQAVIAWMSEYAGWSAEQELQYTTELDAYLYEAVTPVEIEAEPGAIKVI